MLSHWIITPLTTSETVWAVVFCLNVMQGILYLTESGREAKITELKEHRNKDFRECQDV